MAAAAATAGSHSRTRAAIDPGVEGRNPLGHRGGELDRLVRIGGGLHHLGGRRRAQGPTRRGPGCGRRRPVRRPPPRSVPSRAQVSCHAVSAGIAQMLGEQAVANPSHALPRLRDRPPRQPRRRTRCRRPSTAARSSPIRCGPARRRRSSPSSARTSATSAARDAAGYTRRSRPWRSAATSWRSTPSRSAPMVLRSSQPSQCLGHDRQDFRTVGLAQPLGQRRAEHVVGEVLALDVDGVLAPRRSSRGTAARTPGRPVPVPRRAASARWRRRRRRDRARRRPATASVGRAGLRRPRLLPHGAPPVADQRAETGRGRPAQHRLHLVIRPVRLARGRRPGRFVDPVRARCPSDARSGRCRHRTPRASSTTTIFWWCEPPTGWWSSKPKRTWRGIRQPSRHRDSGSRSSV